MRHSIIFILVLLTLITSCNKKTVIINRDFLIGCWVSEKDIYQDVSYLTIEDSLLSESVTGEETPVVPYKISYDTLIITYLEFYNLDYDNGPNYGKKKKPKVFKFKILSLDSLELIIKPIFPKEKDTVFFSKKIPEKKNDLIIDRLEFSSSSCFGTCPCQDLLIGQDSILYHYGYGSFSKHKGYSMHKLNPKEFERIQSRLNSINKDDFRLCNPCPDAQHFHLFLKTKIDSIEIDGMFCEGLKEELEDFIVYLNFIERFVNLDSIEGNGPTIKYKYNKEYF